MRKKMFVSAAVAAVAASTVLVSPAQAATLGPCSPGNNRVFRITVSNGARICVGGQGRLEKDISNVVKIESQTRTGAYDYIDTDGFMTTRSFRGGAVHDLNSVTFHSVYLD
ncbi:hypothetical protein FKR81_26025 [Lentzea tibetensis]|uniref:Beta/Gamma crystallin n=1 Tax=Lentzea tibetensis TaxID=2591470 RepID=A0A563EQR9_9PSEU|nr:hypothetical protein [Lentzea tibetensis]TWP49127.1 hypothetical protein FKR81_26025 [Lentzea tibetensis]